VEVWVPAPSGKLTKAPDTAGDPPVGAAAAPQPAKGPQQAKDAQQADAGARERGPLASTAGAASLAFGLRPAGAVLRALPSRRPAGEWVHIDPCEASIGEPLLYSAGWGKNLTYVVALGDGYISDVTPGYTGERYNETLARRPLSERQVARSIRRVALTTGAPRLRPASPRARM
jgi:hypothetical protein